MTAVPPHRSEAGLHTAPPSRMRYYATAPAEYCSRAGTRPSSHPRPGHQPTLQSSGSGLEIRNTSESLDRPVFVATSLQRPEYDRGLRSFATADHGRIFYTTLIAESENGAFERRRVRWTSSASSS